SRGRVRSSICAALWLVSSLQSPAPSHLAPKAPLFKSDLGDRCNPGNDYNDDMAPSSAASLEDTRHANVGWGIAARRSRVYCAEGATRTCSVGPCSTMRPAFMTMTRSHSSRTTLRSWDTKRYDIPSESLSSCSRLRTTAC